jgi:general secretion pathway protein F
VPVYSYKGVSNSGKSMKGTVSADNLRAARVKMRVDGIFLTNIAETDAVGDDGAEAREGFASRFRIDLPVRIPATERSVATRQLSTLIGAGIPLVESLNALVEQIEHKALKGIFSQVRDKVNEGASLADALASTGNFDTLYISMVRAGEASGALDTVLDRIADYLEDQVRLTSKVTSIIVYPAVMLAFSLVVIVLLVTVVLPQITGLLESMDSELPLMTQIIMDSSDFIRAWWMLLLPLCIGAGVGLYSLKQTERGTAAFDRMLLRTPVVGRITRVVAIARFSRTLASLLGAGVSIIQALDISKHVASNRVIGDVIDGAKVSVLEGATLASPLRASGEFPPMVITMVEVGERAGDLEAMLVKVADTYDEQVEQSITRLTSLLEPLLILVMVGLVLFIVMATLMPLMDITNAMQ